jgi:hypothetical protein
MKKLTLITLIVLLSLAIYLLKLYENQLLDEEPSELKVSYVGKGTETNEIEIKNEKDVIVYSININQLKDWLKENWSSFDKEPTVGMRAVEPANFNFFDQTGSLSPDKETLIFSVHDYSVLTTVSFVITANLESKKLALVNEPVRGEIEKFIWSPDSLHVAYVLNSARAQRDYLSVDSIEEMSKNFVLDQDSLLNTLKMEELNSNEFLPSFRNLKWEDEKLYFTTNSPEEEEQKLQWSINKEGEGLKLVN